MSVLKFSFPNTEYFTHNLIYLILYFVSISINLISNSFSLLKLNGESITSIFESFTTIVEDKYSSDNIVNDAADQDEVTESVDSSAVDSLVDAWLEEHAAVPVAPELEEDKTLIEAPVLETSFDTAAQEQKADHSLNVNSLNNVIDHSIDELSESWSIEQPDSSYDTDPLVETETVST